jgi:hypothetical protein
MKYRLWLNVPNHRIRMISDDLDGPHDAEILMRKLLDALPDAVAGIDTVESRTVEHKVEGRLYATQRRGTAREGG